MIDRKTLFHSIAYSLTLKLTGAAICLALFGSDFREEPILPPGLAGEACRISHDIMEGAGLKETSSDEEGVISPHIGGSGADGIYYLTIYAMRSTI